MTLQIAFRHLNPSDSVREYAEEKTRKLGEYFGGDFRVTWTLSSEHRERVAHCHLTGRHMNYFADSCKDDFLESIDDVVEKLERQVRKHKEVVHQHGQKHRKSRAPAEREVETALTEEEV